MADCTKCEWPPVAAAYLALGEVKEAKRAVAAAKYVAGQGLWDEAQERLFRAVEAGDRSFVYDGGSERPPYNIFEPYEP